MNSYLVTKLPTIYADMNVFRYVAYGDILITNPHDFTWVYSNVHLDEIHRNGNMDALDGIKFLKAVEISDVLNANFQSVENIVLREYIDPYDRFQQHLEAISGYENINDHIDEYLIRFFGADNFEELSKAPDKAHEEIDRLTSIIDYETRKKLLEKSSTASEEIKNVIENNLKDRMPIDKTRNAFGITSEHRKILEKSHSPIDDTWDLISSSIPNITKNQFFGFEPIPGIEGVQRTQHGVISGAHMVLNMLGISPDRGLAKREKIKSVISDGQHTGMASYCNALVSADNAFSNKARSIYTHLGNITNVLHFEYQKGYVLDLGIKYN